MDTDFKHLLAEQIPLIRDSATWGDSRLDVAFYISGLMPPVQHVTSVRAIVFSDDSVLVIRDGSDSYHVWPGGRREPNESLYETLEREILEETRWTIADPNYLGFVHLHHLGEKPPDYRYPYPDFFQIVYVAQAKEHFPEKAIQDDYVLEAGLMPLDQVWDLNIEESQKLLLKAALRLRAETFGDADYQ